MKIRETFVNATKGYQFSETDWYEPYTNEVWVEIRTPKCATVECSNAPTHVLTWSWPDSRHEPVTERVCQECGEAYMRRPVLRASLEIAP